MEQESLREKNPLVDPRASKLLALEAALKSSQYKGSGSCKAFASWNLTIAEGKIIMAELLENEVLESTASRTKQPSSTALISSHGLDGHVPAEAFPFMKLPLELRAMVYKEVMALPLELTVRFFSHGRKTYHLLLEGEGTGHPLQHSPSATCRLFTVSKAFYEEVMPIYFGCTSFIFPTVDSLSLLKNLKPDHRRCITSMSVNYSGRAPAESIKSLHGCTSLRRLSILFDSRTIYSKEKELPLVKRYGVSNLLKLRGISELNVELTNSDKFMDRGRFLNQWDEFVEALQVIKQPRDAASLRRQDAKDYPKENVKSPILSKIMSSPGPSQN
ncbi:MAG: hypothetical protein Q9208_001968 [Pyrenodesmia sp. 3 TL-2023]